MEKNKHFKDKLTNNPTNRPTHSDAYCRTYNNNNYTKYRARERGPPPRPAQTSSVEPESGARGGKVEDMI
jgi:hypothetical protein